jgi:hypothetical protein
MVEQVQVHLQIVVIEERLRHQAFAEQCIGRAQHQHGWPAATGSPGRLADEYRRAAVRRRQDDQRREQFERQISQQIFRYKRSHKEQRHDGRDLSSGRDHRSFLSLS